MNRLWAALNPALKLVEPEWNRARRREEMNIDPSYWRSVLKVPKNKDYKENAQ